MVNKNKCFNLYVKRLWFQRSAIATEMLLQPAVRLDIFYIQTSVYLKRNQAFLLVHEVTTGFNRRYFFVPKILLDLKRLITQEGAVKVYILYYITD